MMIGKKNRLFEFWKLTGAKDAANDPLPDDYEFFKRRWGEIRGETGIGTIRAAASNGGINTPLDRYSVRINYTPSITVDMQMRERDGSRYNIVSVRHDKADREWTDVVGEIGGANG